MKYLLDPLSCACDIEKANITRNAVTHDIAEDCDIAPLEIADSRDIA